MRHEQAVELTSHPANALKEMVDNISGRQVCIEFGFVDTLEDNAMEGMSLELLGVELDESGGTLHLFDIEGFVDIRVDAQGRGGLFNDGGKERVVDITGFYEVGDE